MARAADGFFGRDEERAALCELLMGPSRLVTLLGPAGVGKTRLALEVADALKAKGVPWVSCDLEPVRGPDALFDAVVRAADVNMGGSGGVHQLARALSRRANPVLLLDNAEGVVDALAELTMSMMAAVQDLTLIVTSQVRLHLTEEVCFEVHPVDAEAGARIFEHTARRVAPQTALSAPQVTRIVRGLGGLPLGIELAATRLRYRTLAELAEPDQLPMQALFRGDRGLAARSRSLRAAIKTSWDLMDGPSQQACRRLAVFGGGFNPEDAPAVLSGIEGADPARLVDDLRDRSVLWARPWAGRLRFGLFDSVRQFVEATAQDAEELDELYLGHARHFANASEQMQANLRGRDPVRALRWIAAEQDNLQLAHQRMASVEPELAARLMVALAPRISVQGPVPAHRELLLSGIACASAANAAVLQAQLELALVRSYVVRGEFEEAARWLCEGIALKLTGTSVRLEAEIVEVHIGFRRGLVEGCTLRLDAALKQATALADTAIIGQAMLQHVVVAQVQDPKRGVSLAQDLSRWAQSKRQPRCRVLADFMLGQCLLALRRFDEALAPYERAIEGFRDLQEPVYAAAALAAVADCHQGRGRPLEGLRRLNEGLAEADEAGDIAADPFMRVTRLELLVKLKREAEASADLPATRQALTSFEVRPLLNRMRAIEEALGASLSTAQVQVALDGRAFIQDGRRVDLSRRRAVRRILACLAQAAQAHRAQPLLWEELCTAGWPDADPDDDGARNRTYTAVWTLRSLGLQDVLHTIGEGYQLVGTELSPTL